MVSSTAPADTRERLDVLRPYRFRVLNRQMAVHPDRVAPSTSVLRGLGFDVVQQADAPLEPDPGEVVLVWGNAVWFPEAMRSLERTPAGRRPVVVVWHVEPLPPPGDSGLRWPLPTARELAKIALRDPRASDVYSNVRALDRLARHGLPDVLGVPTKERWAFLAQRGFHVFQGTTGYEPLDGRDLGLERDVDVLFLGSTNLRNRRTALRRLRRAGVRVDVRGSYSDPSLWGEERTRLLNRAKMVLSISRFPGTFGSKRFAIAMACKALVVSDPVYDPEPFVRDVHFVETSLGDMPDAIERYLGDEDARARIADRGHELVTRELPFERTVTRLIAAVGDHVARR